MSGRRTTIAPGIFQDAHGFSVLARIGSGPRERRSPERRFPRDTPIDTLTAAWHTEKQKLLAARALVPADAPIDRGTFADDVRRYFTIATLETQRIQERTAQFQWWSHTIGFARRRRDSLKPAEIRGALNRLERSASTRNKYRTALSHLFTVLDGKNAPNPCRDVPKDAEPLAERRDQSYLLIDAILAHMRDRGQAKTLSRTKARYRVLAYVPVTPAQLKRMSAADVHLTRDPATGSRAGYFTAPRRRKGKAPRPGTPAQADAKPLSPDGIAAFDAFTAAGCWDHQTPSRSAMRKTFIAARDAAILELRRSHPDLDLSRAGTMRPYDLRHSIGTLVYQRTHSERRTQQMLDHADPRTTKRYTQGAVPDDIAIAGAALAAAFAGRPVYTRPTSAQPAPTSAHRLPRTLTAVSGNARKTADQSGPATARKSSRKKRERFRIV